MNLQRIKYLPLLLLTSHIVLSRSFPGFFWWGLGVIILLQLFITVYGCINISSGYFLKVLCNAKTHDKVVALTFDDGPATSTAGILETLKKYNVEVAFFCIGKNIPGNEQILQTIDRAGHIIGNHSYSHGFWFDMMSAKRMLTDIEETDKAVMRLTGKKPKLFRPPYGVTNPAVRDAVTKGRYLPIGWNIRSMDTVLKNKESLLIRILDRLTPGSIILLHDSMEITEAILPGLIESIKSRGYEIVRLDKMLNIPAYA